MVGPPLFWIGLNRPPYYLDYVDFYVWERIRRERSVAWPQFIDEIRPAVRPAGLEGEVGRGRTTAPRFLESNAELVASFRHVNYTRVEVWKMRGAAR